MAVPTRKHQEAVVTLLYVIPSRSLCYSRVCKKPRNDRSINNAAIKPKMFSRLMEIIS